MHRFASKITHVSKTGFHTSSQCLAISRFNLPAMSPTMTEGTIHKWMKKEGDTFVAGDVLLELETDKAQIDVEAPEDGVLAKILLKDGSKAPVNTLIALLAEEGDDISSVEVPAEEASNAAPVKTEEKKEEKPTTQSTPSISPISHHDIDTSKLKKPLSPAVLSLVLKYGIKDVNSIKASGNGDRILKGDVLAHLGLIKPKPAPKATLSIAPPRDQIVFAKTEKATVEKEVKKEQVPTFISKNIVIDNLYSLRHTLNEQHGTHVSVNDIIAKAAERALQDVSANKNSIRTTKPIVYKTNPIETKQYTGGQFKVFHLAEPTYDFISDSYQTSKPYVLSVGKPISTSLGDKKKVSSDKDMMDLISYLGGESQQPQVKTISLANKTELLSGEKNKENYQVQVTLDGFVPGKILNDKKAHLFLGQVEHYIRNPNELV